MAKAAKSPRVVAGIEPDPVTRRLIELYLAPLDYRLRWVESLDKPVSGTRDMLAFLLSSNALPDLKPESVATAVQRLGKVPVLGLAGDRHPFPPGVTPAPLRRVLRKPVRAEELLSALQAIQEPSVTTSETPAPLQAFEAMVTEMGMDTAMVVDLCQSFIERGEHYLKEAMAAADPRDNTKLDRIAHAFKGMAGNMRLQRVTALAEELRRAAKEQTGDVQSLTRNLQTEFGVMRTLLQERWLKDSAAELA